MDTKNDWRERMKEKRKAPYSADQLEKLSEGWRSSTSPTMTPSTA
jgi:hypothetical protein